MFSLLEYTPDNSCINRDDFLIGVSVYNIFSRLKYILYRTASSYGKHGVCKHVLQRDGVEYLTIYYDVIGDCVDVASVNFHENHDSQLLWDNSTEFPLIGFGSYYRAFCNNFTTNNDTENSTYTYCRTQNSRLKYLNKELQSKWTIINAII